MSARFLPAAGFVFGVMCVSSLVLEAQKPALPDVLRAAGDYLQTYSKQLGTVVGEEEFTQRDTSAANISRRLHSVFVMVGAEDGSIASFRDVYAVDGSQVRERDDRLVRIFQNPSSSSSPEEQALLISEEGLRYYLSPNFRSLDRPTVALEFLRQVNQAQSEFGVDGVRKSDGAQVATLEFKARSTSAVLPTPPGSTTTGRFWVDVETGTIRQTEVVVSSKQFTFKATAKYAADKDLGVWLPTELAQQIDVSGSGTGGFSNMGEGGGMGARQSLDGRARYSKFRRP